MTKQSENQKNFMKERFGLFLHWGCYAQMGKGEWAMFQERIPVQEYAQLASTFDPKSFDPWQWARIAKNAGMRYMVLTARHHDGFCLFDSKVSDFTSVKCSPQHRDYVAEYVQACRESGLKVGLYYSEMDWRFRGYFHYKTDIQSAEAMRKQCHDQVIELMSNYGKIDILWYDGLWLAHDVKTDTTDSPVFWQGMELNARVRELQPQIVINNRLGDPADFDTPEGAVSAPKDPERAWECCKTMTHGWGHYGGTPDYLTRSAADVIRDLISSSTSGGNYLLNIGVTPDGQLPSRSANVLLEIGEWMRSNGESIYGSEKIDFHTQMEGWSKKSDVYYYHLTFNPLDGRLVIPLLDARVKEVSLLGSNHKLTVEYASNHRIIVSGLPLIPPVAPFMTLKFQFESAPKSLFPENDNAAWLTGEA